mgnify:FL=1
MNNKYPEGSKKLFQDASEAFEEIREIYNANVSYLKKQFKNFTKGSVEKDRIRAFYPYLRVQTHGAQRSDSRLSYGFVPRPGIYETTLTRPDIFDHYLKKQMDLLLKNHE